MSSRAELTFITHAMTNYWAHAMYLFETLKESTTMYNGNYSEHLRNCGVLKLVFSTYIVMTTQYQANV
ncbi:hypothetical protein T12_9893 [Trichinella patagoniensis]|uniref:Uncharacterized protein n=1 Tax=Trichinella patagoniensis TaxID=990121 RepID=A0A0V0ZJY1_9BILA|nr:hypothetical protein T12_9893 [Trichinella patagoniensis]